MRWRILLALLAVALLGACTALPTSSPVHTSNPRLPDRSEVDVLYSGPTAGADPAAIVEGFLAASAAGFADEFSAAKEYLTSEAAGAWDPYAGVDIIDSTTESVTTEVESGAIEVATMSRADVDSRGRYTAKPQPVGSTRTYSLVKDADDQWRIAVLPDGLVIPDARFEQIFDRAYATSSAQL